MKWERVTIFISSTFNDMHAERDYLVKDVFPELREWCEERKIHLIDVDLRWGVTEEDSSSNHTVLACLNNIDESRPFFLCFLGQRRGWIPKKGDVSPETLDEYPDISDIVGRNSVTEMEIEHALLSPMKHIVNGNEKLEIPVRHALFYFRSTDYLDDLTSDQRKIFTNEAEEDIDLADNELIRFKENIKSKWDYSIDYDCNWDKSIISPELPENVHQGRLTDFSIAGKDLKDIIIEQLKEEIIKEFPDREKVEYASDLERDLDQQALFIELNSEGFISREGDFDALNDYVTNDRDGLFILTAAAGSGKSMLLANFIKKESKNHAGRFFNRFCGVSDLSSQQFLLWKTIFDEAHIECPDTLKDLKDKIEDLFKELAKEKTVLIIDAVNQLPDGLDMLEWLPKKLPQNLKIILSLKEDEKDKEITECIEKLKENENISLSTVQPFKNKEEKRKLIKDYLKKYLKALDDQQIDTICDFEGSKNPLYLKVLLSELRIFGSFGQLSKEIKQFGETPKEAFNTVLNRLENDINSSGIDSKAFTPLLFDLLANARNGLSEKEIISCMQKELGLDEEKLVQAIRLFIRQVRPFMARREGRTDYFYEAFKLASKERYIRNNIHYNKLLADYFKEQADPEADLSFKGKNIRDFNELPYHLKESENTNCLEKILSTYLWIKNKSELSDIQNTINDYNYIDVENKDYYHVKLIKDTLIMSSHVLKDTIKNLPTQLWGRLKDIESLKVKELLIEIGKYTDYPWLKPRHHMHSPEDALKVTLTGHTKSVTSVCFSPDGKYIASGSEDITVRVWDWKAQKEVRALTGHIISVTSICFSPDGKYIASGSEDHTIRIWDWETQKEVKALTGHSKSVTSVCFSPDGKYIASGSEDNTVRVWDWENQKEIVKIEGHTSVVYSVCFSPDGKYVASGSQDTVICVWDWGKQTEICRLEGHKNGVKCLCFSSDDKYLVSGSFDDTVRIWDWKKQIEVRKFKHTWGVFGVCFSPDDKYVVSGSADNSVHVWDWEKQMEIRKFEHTSTVSSVYFSPDGKYIASGSDDNSVRIWDWKKQSKTRKFESLVRCLCFSPDGKYVASGSEDNIVRVWDWEKQIEIRKLEGHTEIVLSVCFSSDNKYIASGSSDKSVRVWNWEEQTEITILKDLTSAVSSVCFSPDNKYIVSGAAWIVRIWDWKNQTEIRKLEGDINALNSICFSPDGKYIVLGLGIASVSIWDWKNQTEINKLKKDIRSSINSVHFSPNGKHFVFGSGERNRYNIESDVHVWDWKCQREKVKLGGHVYRVLSVCFSPDGKYIASGSEDNTIRVWDWEKQMQTIVLNAKEPITSCVFSNNNRQIAGGSFGQILMYDIENLPAGIVIVTALRDLDNHLIVRCNYCGNLFDTSEDKLGIIVKCPHCDEELQLNVFTADTVIIEDESAGIDSNNIYLPDEKIENQEDIVDNNDAIEKNYSIKSEKKKGFFSRLFRR